MDASKVSRKIVRTKVTRAEMEAARGGQGYSGRTKVIVERPRDYKPKDIDAASILHDGRIVVVGYY